MKNLNVMRGYTGLQAFFPTTSNNVQEIEPTNTVSVVKSDDTIESARPRVLTQRNARRARRFAH
ncbi:MAG: hypothetical protein HRT81_04880 [Henriciella sp.]|nr:hypothetical protein [Henriciella sp.]